MCEGAMTGEGVYTAQSLQYQEIADAHVSSSMS